jgi:signal transduction histidine kinase
MIEISSTVDVTAASQDSDLENGLFFRNGIALSMVQMALVAAASAFYIHWWALLWLVFMTVLLFRGSGRTQHQVPSGSAGNTVVFVCACVFIAAWGAAWLVGGPEAGFIAGSLFGTQALTASSLFASSRTNFWAFLIPSALVAVVGPIFVGASPAIVFTTLLCVFQMLLFANATRAHRNAMVEELVQVHSQMQSARKESLAKSQFLATMSHELRTPLNAIIGYAEILEEDSAANERKDNAADAARIQRSARNLLSLINEVLDFSKIEAGRMDVQIDEVNLAALLNEVTQSVSHITSAHYTEVSIKIAPEAATVWTDDQRLRQCVLNLVSNAAKFTEGGQIKVYAGLEKEADDNFLRVEVADTGCGVSEEEGARLFQPFSQGDSTLTRNHEGIGLGLAITSRLSELMGGDVRCVSAKGVGSTFTLRVRDHSLRNTASPDGKPIVQVINHRHSDTPSTVLVAD